jgi:hypothetical protein
MGDGGTHELGLDELRERLRSESSDSRQLLLDIQENPICRVLVDESIPCVSIAWKRYATSMQLRFVHESALELLRVRGLTKILGDDSNMPIIHEQDQAWIVDSWMPRAIQAGLRAVASKAPTSRFGQFDLARIQSAAPPPLILRSFESLDEARSWLRDA